MTKCAGFTKVGLRHCGPYRLRALHSVGLVFSRLLFNSELVFSRLVPWMVTRTSATAAAARPGNAGNWRRSSASLLAMSTRLKFSGVKALSSTTTFGNITTPNRRAITTVGGP
eukprot:5848239-Pyramimonas_sp.AAC.2